MLTIVVGRQTGGGPRVSIQGSGGSSKDAL